MASCERLVGLDDTGDRAGLLRACGLKEAVPPAERGFEVDVVLRRSLAEAHTVDERMCVTEPFLAQSQAGERRVARPSAR